MHAHYLFIIAPAPNAASAILDATAAAATASKQYALLPVPLSQGVPLGGPPALPAKPRRSTCLPRLAHSSLPSQYS